MTEREIAISLPSTRNSELNVPAIDSKESSQPFLRFLFE
jgi:hypothetical protein